MAILSRTKGLFSQMVSDIRKITFWINIVVQSIFFIFYIYSIYESINKLKFLVVYSVLLLIATINFITYLTVHVRKSKKPKHFNRALRIIKYLTNGTMLGFNVFVLIKNGISDLNKIILVISAISLLIQVIIEFVRLFIEKYARLVTTSLEMDLGVLSKLGEVKEVKGNFFTLLNSPIEALANKLDHKEPQLLEDEMYLNDLAEKYEEQRLVKKAQKKVERKNRSEERAKIAKKKIVENLGRIKNHIFKKQTNQDDEKAS